MHIESGLLAKFEAYCVSKGVIMANELERLIYEAIEKTNSENNWKKKH
jgi:hypothetical protein